jgi:hypothetical protein
MAPGILDEGLLLQSTIDGPTGSRMQFVDEVLLAECESLALGGSAVGTVELQMLFEAIAPLSTLKRLSLRNVPLSSAAVQSLSRLLHADTVLQSLDLANCSLTGTTAKSGRMGNYGVGVAPPNSALNGLLNASQHHPALRILNLAENGLDDSHMTAVSHVVREAAALEALDLARNGISKAGLAVLVRALELNPAVSALTLSGNSIRRGGSGSGGGGSSKDRQESSSTSLGDQYLAILGPALGSLRGLRHFACDRCGVTDTGAFALAAALAASGSVSTSTSTSTSTRTIATTSGDAAGPCFLQSLHLRENAVTAAGVTALADALEQHNGVLRTVILDGNRGYSVANSPEGPEGSFARARVRLEALLQRNRDGAGPVVRWQHGDACVSHVDCRSGVCLGGLCCNDDVAVKWQAAQANATEGDVSVGVAVHSTPCVACGRNGSCVRADNNTTVASGSDGDEEKEEEEEDEEARRRALHRRQRARLARDIVWEDGGDGAADGWDQRLAESASDVPPQPPPLVDPEFVRQLEDAVSGRSEELDDLWQQLKCVLVGAGWQSVSLRQCIGADLRVRIVRSCPRVCANVRRGHYCVRLAHWRLLSGLLLSR